jgi:hypothetical protein
LHIVHYNLTTTTKEGGVETFVWELAGEQARQGHRVTIVSGAGPLRRDIPGVEVRTAAYVDRERFAFGPVAKGLRSPQAGRAPDDAAARAHAP